MEKVIDGRKDVNKFSILPSLDHKFYLTCILAALPSMCMCMCMIVQKQYFILLLC